MRNEGYILTETSPTLPSLYTVPKPVNTGDINGGTVADISEGTTATRLTHQLLTLHSLVSLLTNCLKVDPSKVQLVSASG